MLKPEQIAIVRRTFILTVRVQ